MPSATGQTDGVIDLSWDSIMIDNAGFKYAEYK